MASSQYYITRSAGDGCFDVARNIYRNSDYSLLLAWDIYENIGHFEAFLFFENINIPKNAIITNAIFNLSVWTVDNGNVTTKFRSCTSNSLPDTVAQFNSLVSTNSYSQVTFPINQAQVIQIDIRDIVQEKVNLSDWKAGNNILLYTTETTKSVSNAGVDLDSFDYIPTRNYIFIEYEIPETITPKGILGATRNERFEYELLSLNNGIYKTNSFITNYVEKGDIKIDFTRDIIGNANFELSNEADVNFVSDLIRPWYIVNHNEIDYKIPLGTYLLSSPVIYSDGTFLNRNVKGFDLLLAVDQDRTTQSVTYTVGTNVIATIKNILGSVASWVSYNIEDSTATLTEPKTFELGKSKLFIINSLLKTINYYPLWCNGLGIFCAIPWSDKNNITWYFLDDSSSLYESGIKDILDYSELYNKVVIISNQLTENTEPIVATLTFEDLNLSSSPLSYTSIGRYITKVFDSETVTQDYANSRAKRELLKMLEIEREIEYNNAFVTNRLDDGLPYQGDCYHFRNTKLDIDQVFKLVSMNFDLEVGGNVNTKIRRVQNV